MKSLKYKTAQTHVVLTTTLASEHKLTASHILNWSIIYQNTHTIILVYIDTCTAAQDSSYSCTSLHVTYNIGNFAITSSSE